MNPLPAFTLELHLLMCAHFGQLQKPDGRDSVRTWRLFRTRMSDAMIKGLKSRIFVACVIAALAAAGPPGADAAEKVGEAVKISTRVSGSGGALSAGDAIHRDEQIRSNSTGQGAFVFEDGTKLALGPGSAITIDEFVYRGGSRFEKLAIGASKGTFRWISGKSDHSAYSIKTPSGALGVRGTAFDVYVGPDGLTAVTLLSGAAEFCTSKGCQRINQRCDFLIARPDGTISRPKGVVNDLGIGRRGRDVFPFLSGKSGLPRGFKAESSCAGLNTSAGGVGGSGLARDPARPGFSPPKGDGGGRGPNDGGTDGPKR